MNKHSRARQFIPFQALKGFNRLIKEKEKVKIANVKKLSDDELDFKLKQLKPFDFCNIFYQSNNEIKKICGLISKIDFNEKFLVCIKEKIYFNQILDLKCDTNKKFDE